ncbi:MAG: hypothetical protein QG597_3064 [Actinomycetota bacterium]|nr:hypothetical protein [Actinomycetota bacterium]
MDGPSAVMGAAAVVPGRALLTASAIMGRNGP